MTRAIATAILATAAIGLLASAAADGPSESRPATGPAAAPKARPKYVAVFDLSSPARPARGRQLADSIRLHLRREGKGRFEVIDRLTTAELTPAAGLSLRTPDERVLALMRERIGCHLAVFGDVQKVGRTVRAEVRCIDLSGDEPTAWTKAFSDDTERARGLIARGVVEAITGRPSWRPPEYGDEDEPERFGDPLNVNGGFDGPGHKGWHAPDNVATRLILDGRDGRDGRVLCVNTDLDRDAWLKYQRDLLLGRADPSDPPKIGTVKNKYATVAALEGVHYRSEWIDATAGQRYWLTADMSGTSAGMFFPKIFVKGFADFSARAEDISERSLRERGLTPDDFARLPEARRREIIREDAEAHTERHRREVYRWYLACRNEGGGWKHFAAPFPPRGGLPANVRWLRIEVYAYWPPGEYLFDDVRLYKDPRQKAPVPEQQPRTPNDRKPSTRPAARPSRMGDRPRSLSVRLPRPADSNTAPSLHLNATGMRRYTTLSRRGGRLRHRGPDPAQIDLASPTGRVFGSFNMTAIVPPPPGPSRSHTRSHVPYP
jgi:hypothetical protein